MGGGGSPAGGSGQIQFNDNGVFGADVNFTFNKTNNILNLHDNSLQIDGHIGNMNGMYYQQSTDDYATGIFAAFGTDNGTDMYYGQAGTFIKVDSAINLVADASDIWIRTDMLHLNTGVGNDGNPITFYDQITVPRITFQSPSAYITSSEADMTITGRTINLVGQEGIPAVHAVFGFQSDDGYFSSYGSPGITSTILGSYFEDGLLVTASDKIITSGGSPSVSTCGTSPSVSGNDSKGVISVGSGVVTACTLTFNSAYSYAPVCVVSSSMGSISAGITSIGTSSFTIGLSATLGGGKIYYICMG